jgi:hypothetical protein
MNSQGDRVGLIWSIAELLRLTSPVGATLSGG